MAQQGASYVEQVLARLRPLGPVTARAMFGGWGIYLDDVMFALVAKGRLYLKADAETSQRFAGAGSQPFAYQGKRGPVAMSYWLLPAERGEDEASLMSWAGLALAAARRAKAARKRRRSPRR